MFDKELACRLGLTVNLYLFIELHLNLEELRHFHSGSSDTRNRDS